MPAEIIKFWCPACQKKISAPRVHAGKKGHCPTCQAAVEIPAESTTAPNGVAGSEPQLEVVVPVAEEGSQGGTAKPKPEFIKLNCPGCGKMVGFQANLGGQAAACPSCHIKIMVPGSPEEIPFIVGSAAVEKPAPKPQPKLVPISSRRLPGAQTHPARARTRFSAKFIAFIAVCVLAAALLAVSIPMWREKHKPDEVSAAASNLVHPPAPAPVPAPGTAEKTATPAAELDKDQPKAGEKSAAQPKADDMPALPAAAEPVNEQSEDSNIIVMVREKMEPLKVLDDLDDGPAAETRKESTLQPPAGKAANKQPAAKLLENKVPPPPALPAAAVCPVCLGTGYVPTIPARPYVRLNTAAAGDPALAAPWCYCPKCNAGKDPQTLVQAETARLANADAKRQQWETLTGMRFLDVETRHITLHTKLPPEMAKLVGARCDKLAAHLESLTHTTVLTQTRPDTHEILILWNRPEYEKFIDALEQAGQGGMWALARKSSGAMSRHMGFFNANRDVNTPPEHMALFQLAKMLIEEATDGKAQPWLTEGFASYCENAVTQQNLCYSFSYEMNEVRFGRNWDADIKKFAQQRKLKTWNLIFPQDLVALKALDYLTCYSMVSYLIKADPRRFILFVNNLRAGLENSKALEQAYGRPVKDLQNLWGQWTLR